MIYYIADMHFGHTNVLRFDNRPFLDTAQMDDTVTRGLSLSRRLRSKSGGSPTWFTRPMH